MKRLGVLLLVMMLYEMANAQFYIGLRDSKYAFFGYKWDAGWAVRLDQSIFDESLKYQYIRCTGEYQMHIKYFALSLATFVGTTYSSSFYDLGLSVKGTCHPLRWLGIGAEITPRYDSWYKYTTCYMLGVDFHVSDELALLAQYSTVPEYRISEKRVKAGLRFAVKNLTVSPMLSFPIEGNAKSLRILVGLQYDFPKITRAKTD